MKRMMTAAAAAFLAFSIPYAVQGVAAPGENGYHAKGAPTPDTEKFVQLNFDAPRKLDRIVLVPSCPVDFKPITPGLGFPIRYKIEVADNPEFKNPKIVVDKTAADVMNPGYKEQKFDLKGIQAKHIRVTATKLWNRAMYANPFCFSLAEVEVYSDGKNIAPEAKCTALDSIESDGYSLNALTDGKKPEPKAGLNTNGYHAQRSATDQPKFVTVELDDPAVIDQVILYPCCPRDIKPETPGFGFPKRFKVELSETPDFASPVVIADYTQNDFVQNEMDPLKIDGKKTKAKYIRVSVTKNYLHKLGSLPPYCFALSEMQVLSGGKNVALFATVSAQDSVEGWGWAARNLTDGSIAD